MPKASIIIPVYNKEKYISETLTCIDGQTVNDIEVIIINDASTDNSMNIITDFKNNTKKCVRLFQNEKNCGVAYSRNLGINEAKTDYITFVDADDIIERNYIEVMISKTRKYPYIDIIRGLVMPFKKNVGIIATGEIDGYNNDQIIIPKLDHEYILSENISCSSRFYKKDFIKNLKFKESLFEDYEFFLETMIKCNTVLYTDEPLYAYRFIDDGKYQNSIYNFRRSCIEYLDIFDRVLENNNDVDKELIDVLKEKHFDMCFSYFSCLNHSNVTLEDKQKIMEYYLMYFYKCYGLKKEVIKNIIGKELTIMDTPSEIKTKIKQIVSKY